jgi:hypothetical protein
VAEDVAVALTLIVGVGGMAEAFRAVGGASDVLVGSWHEVKIMANAAMIKKIITFLSMLPPSDSRDRHFPS